MTIAENEIHGSVRHSITPVVEDYLKAIYTLQQKNKTVRTIDLAEHLRVKPPTVTSMLKTLAELKLAKHRPYYGTELTAAGHKIALEVVRHHRLIETYLVEALGYSWDEVHEEAEVLEHFISERLEKRITEYLGDPIRDPHGDPIPAIDGTLPDIAAATLADMPANSSAEILRVMDQNSERLRYLAGIGLTPGNEVKIIEKAPFKGPLTISINQKTHAIDHQMARSIIVRDKDL